MLLEPGWLTPVRAMALQVMAATVALVLGTVMFMHHFGGILLHGGLEQAAREGDEMERVHVEQWQSVSGSDRANAAWEMVVEAWKLKKRNLDELRFQRSVTRVERAGS